MSLNRRNPKRDANEPSVVREIRRIGVDALLISSAGAPDVLTHQPWTGSAAQLAFVYRYGLFMPLEIKRERGRLTPKQKRERIADKWPIVRSEAEALALYGVKA